MKTLATVLSCVLVLAMVSVTAFGQTDEIPCVKGSLLPAPPAVAINDPLTRDVLSFDFDAARAGVQLSGGWVLAGTPRQSGQVAAVGLPGGYADLQQAELTLEGASLPALSDSVAGVRMRFAEWFEIESGFDNGRILLSADDGGTWTEVDRRSGVSDWRTATLDLSPFAGQTVRIRFELRSDSSLTFGGWQVDDVHIVQVERTALNVTLISLSSQNFPFVYLNVNAARGGTALTELTAGNFQVTENGVVQTDYFDVTPPAEGGGVRLVDIVFCVDNSGSMGDDQANIRNNMINFVNSLVTAGANFGLGLLRFGQNSNGGWPLVQDGGALTNDVNYFKNTVWARNTVDGGMEPGWDALYSAASNYSYRPGAQRILVLVTDEDQTYSSNSYTRTQAAVISLLQSQTATAFCVIDQTWGSSVANYCPIATATNGACFQISQPWNQILDYISTLATATYVVTYRSSQPTNDGVLRHVVTTVTDGGDAGSCSGDYTPGSAPRITRSAETVALEDDNWVEGTSFLIEADISDVAPPFVTGATLYFRSGPLPLLLPYASIPMTYVAGDRWRGTIAGANVHAYGVQYYISATDGQTTATDPSVLPTLLGYSIAILPNERPELNHTPLSEYRFGEALDISCEANDITDELQSVVLYYRKIPQLSYNSLIMSGDGTYTATIPVAVAGESGLEYYIKATDNYGVFSTSGDADHPHKIWPFWEARNQRGETFDLAEDGWQFANSESHLWTTDWNTGDPADERICCSRFLICWDWGRVFPTWQMYRNAFGQSQVEEYVAATSTWKRRQLAEETWNNINSCWAGSCYGMATEALLIYTGHLVAPGGGTTYQATDVQSRDQINQYFIYQFGGMQRQQMTSVRNNTVNQTLAAIRTALQRNTNSQFTLSVRKRRPNETGDDGGHAINIRRLERTDDKHYRLHVYDNNSPNSDGELTFNTTGDGSWSYPGLSGWHGRIFLRPVELALVRPQWVYIPASAVFAEREVASFDMYFSGATDIIIRNPAGQAVSFVDSSISEEIAEAYALLPETGSVTRPIGFSLPEDTYEIEHENVQDSVMRIMLSTGNRHFVAVHTGALPSQVDRYVFDALGNVLTVDNRDGMAKAFNLTLLEMAEASEERMLKVNNWVVEPANHVMIGFESGSYVLDNLGGPQICDLMAHRLGNGSYVEFSKPGLHVPANATLHFRPDWSGTLAMLPVLIDSSRDGTVDDTLWVRNDVGIDMCNADTTVEYAARGLMPPTVVSRYETGKGLVLNWTKAPGMEFYRVYRGAWADSLEAVAFTRDTTWADTTVLLRDDKVRFYEVRAFRTETRSADPTGETGYWPMEEGTGDTTEDVSGSGRGAQLHGTDWISYEHDGYSCNALRFGNQQWASVPNADAFYGGTWQLDLELRLESLPTSSPYTLVSNARYAPVNGGFTLRVEPGGYLRAQVCYDNAWQSLQAVAPLPVGQWARVSLIINGDESMLVVDDVIVAMGEIEYNPANNAMPLSIGTSTLPNGLHQYFLHGDIAWLRWRSL